MLTSAGKMKAQVSMEFMILIFLLVLLFVLYTQNSFSVQKDMITIKIEQDAKQVSDKIAFEINTAVSSGNGYARRFYVENSFSGISDFTISVENYEATISWSQESVSSQITTKNITGVISKGWNLIENRVGDIHVS
jgi:hypothetical protein